MCGRVHFDLAVIAAEAETSESDEYDIYTDIYIYKYSNGPHLCHSAETTWVIVSVGMCNHYHCSIFLHQKKGSKIGCGYRCIYKDIIEYTSIYIYTYIKILYVWTCIGCASLNLTSHK